MALSIDWLATAIAVVMVVIFVSIVVQELRAQKRRRDGLTAAVQGRQAEGGWIHGTRDQRPWRLRIAERRHGGSLIEMIVPAQLSQTVEVHRRDALDSAAAAMGLLHHQSTGDRGFDDALIVFAATHPSSPGANAAASMSAETRAALRRMVRDGLESFIWSMQDRAVVARWRSGATPADARQVATVLTLAAATTAPAAPMDAEPDAKPVQAAQAGTVGTGVAVTSMVVICMLAIGGFAAIALDAAFMPLDRGPLLWAATVAAALASIGWGFVTWRIRGWKATDHKAWIPMMVVAFPAFWVVAYAAAVAINGAVDDVEPSVVEGLVEAKTRVPRSGTADYELRTTAGSFPITATLYHQVREGDRVSVSTRAGRLGVPWRGRVTDIRLIDQRR